jgi:AbrB family looped-hinge helix DNA binding protein
LTEPSPLLSIIGMLSVKVSTKHQIVVPSRARRALGIEAGDRLSVEVTSEAIVLRPRVRRAGARLRGLGSEAWQGLDPVEYVRQLREEWDERLPR